MLNQPQEKAEQQADPQSGLRWVDLRVELTTRRVYRGSERLNIKGLTFDLLAFFARSQGDLVTIDQIADSVWHGDAVGNEVVTQRVRMLRRGLGDDPSDPRYIATARGRGYRVLVAVPEQPTDSPRAGADTSRRVPWIPLTAVVVLALLGTYLLMSDKPPADDPLLERARYYSQLGQADNALRAIALYRQRLASDPDHVEARLGLSFSLSQRVCQHDDDPALAQESAALARELLETDEQFARAHAALAYASDCLGRIDQALEGYLRAFELEPHRGESLASAAHLMQIKGHLADALQHNLKAISTAGEKRLRFADLQVARVLDLMDFDVAAQQRYARTVQLYPDNVFAAAAHVRFLLSRGRLAEARSAADKAQALGASSTELYLLQAELAALADDLEASRAYLEQVAEFAAPGSWGVTLAGVANGKDADSAWLESRVALVVAAIEQGDLWPSNWLELAYIHNLRNDHGKATAALREAVAAGYLDRAYLTHSYWFRPLRSYPDFPGILAAMREAAIRERDLAMAAQWWESALILPSE